MDSPYNITRYISFFLSIHIMSLHFVLSFFVKYSTFLFSHHILIQTIDFLAIHYTPHVDVLEFDGNTPTSVVGCCRRVPSFLMLHLNYLCILIEKVLLKNYFDVSLLATNIDDTHQVFIIFGC